MAARHFYFATLFYGDITPFLPSLVNHFYVQQQHYLLHQIIDIGLGSIYREISNSLQSKIINIIPLKIKYRIKQKHNKSHCKALQFIQLRQQIFVLSKHQFIEFLCNLCKLLMPKNNLFAKMLQFGFEHYKNINPLTLNILHHIINDLCDKFAISSKYVTNLKNSQETLCYGYCRDDDIPCDIIQICYYYYFILYFASTTTQIHQIFGNKYIVKNTQFMNIKLMTNTNVCDLWDKSITNIKNTINSSLNMVERSQPHQQMKHEWFSAFGTKIISFGQRKVWNLQITPYVGNMLFGVVKCIDIDYDGRVNNKYTIYNKKDDFAFNGFAFMAGSGMAYHGIKAKRITNKTYDFIPRNRMFAVTLILDMTELQCSLQIVINGYDVGIIFDKEIDPTNKYKLAVAMHEPQKVEIL